MKLAAFLSAKNLSVRDFAGMIGRERSVVSKYCSGSVKPSLSAMEAIHKATDGAVSLFDFTEGEEERA